MEALPSECLSEWMETILSAPHPATAEPTLIIFPPRNPLTQSSPASNERSFNEAGLRMVSVLVRRLLSNGDELRCF